MYADAEDIPLPDSDEEEEQLLVDDNICSEQELERLFQYKCKILDEQATTLKKDYILSLCIDSSLQHVVAGLSNGTVQIFKISSQRGLELQNSSFITPPAIGNKAEVPNICGVRFLDESSQHLLVGSTNGLVRLYDLRTEREEKCFKNKFDCNFTCFDSNANGRILCTGSEQFQHEVFLTFYDIRQGTEMGCYSDSHQDDVTTIKFHRENPDLFCCGSTDGLINVFDIQKDNEDDALTTTINTESSVHKLNWHKDEKSQDIISCITHTNDFKIFECEEGDEIASFEREQITSAMKRKTAANCNVVNAHSTSDGNTFLLVGTNLNKGEILRSLLWNNNEMTPYADFEDNKQIVRESVYDEKHNLLITGGESSIVSIWASHRSSEVGSSNSSSMKLKAKNKKHNKKTLY